MKFLNIRLFLVIFIFNFVSLSFLNINAADEPEVAQEDGYDAFRLDIIPEQEHEVPREMGVVENAPPVVVPVNPPNVVPPAIVEDLIAHDGLYLGGIRQLAGLNQDQKNRIISIDFSNRNIGELAPNVFNGLHHLQDLNLSGCNIVNLQPNVFNGLNSLQYLDLYNNQIVNLRPNVFNGLGNLQCLNLNENRIEILQPNVFNGLGNLQSLNLS